jgi:hypothetical protein
VKITEFYAKAYGNSRLPFETIETALKAFEPRHIRAKTSWPNFKLEASAKTGVKSHHCKIKIDTNNKLINNYSKLIDN